MVSEGTEISPPSTRSYAMSIGLYKNVDVFLLSQIISVRLGVDVTFTSKVTLLPV